MSGDLISLRMLMVGGPPAQQKLWREGAAQASVLIEFESAGFSAAKIALGRGGVDFCVLDTALNHADTISVLAAARAKRPAPLVFVCAPRGRTRPDNVDGVLPVPADAGEARKLVDICVRAKMPTPVLLAAIPNSLRGIVRKILGACRFDLVVHEASTAPTRSSGCARAGSAWCLSIRICPGSTARTFCRGLSTRARTSPSS